MAALRFPLRKNNKEYNIDESIKNNKYNVDVSIEMYARRKKTKKRRK